MKRIIIDYDETQEGEDGEPLDLFSYLENELSNDGIETTIKGVDTPKQYETDGYALAMEVLQSTLYERLSDTACAECDEFIKRGQA